MLHLNDHDAGCCVELFYRVCQDPDSVSKAKVVHSSALGMGRGVEREWNGKDWEWIGTRFVLLVFHFCGSPIVGNAKIWSQS